MRRLPGQDRWCYGYFNSRTSCEVRRGLVRAGIAADIFQLTHLLRGATGIARCSISASLISTHAPLARCDAVPDYRRRQSGDFNSRTSCEVRPDALMQALADDNFNSRTSCEVRPLLAGNHSRVLPFQLTHLLRGATRLLRSPSSRPAISTHAPLARCD